MDLNKQYLLSAFLAMEPPDCLISLARKCGGGSFSEDVQLFIWSHCFNTSDENCHVPYLKNLLKKFIKDIESSGGSVLDEFYERYANYMVSVKEDGAVKGDSWIVKHISFLSHGGQMQVTVSLRCSLNMLQGDTGCALWPSSLFLSEFVLSFPEVFTRKSCFEVGSGVGLLGVCLHHVKAAKVVLTDGDASSLRNLKLNLEMNKITNLEDNGTDVVQCIHLPWESARENELLQFRPDIILGADVIYDPSCIPHLVRVLSILLNRQSAGGIHRASNSHGPVLAGKIMNNNCASNNNGSPEITNYNKDDFAESDEANIHAAAVKSLLQEIESGPVAFIASVIRNVDTFNCFLDVSRHANLLVRDLTETIRFANLLPYMETYKRSDNHEYLLGSRIDSRWAPSNHKNICRTREIIKGNKCNSVAGGRSQKL